MAKKRPKVQIFDYVVYEVPHSLRGRPLNGRISKLEDFQVAVVKLPKSMNDESTCHTVSTCDKLTIWNYDLPHGKGDDPLSRGLTYSLLAKIVHL